jgi:hypothetical protein
VDLRIPSRGWLGTLAAACIAIAALMISVAIHGRLMNNEGHWSTDEITNIVVLLVGICAGAATYVAQQHATDVVARLASGLRALGLVAICVPAATAVGVVYVDDSPVTGARFVKDSMSIWVMAVITVVIAAMVLLAWLRVLAAELSVGRQSVWDMTTVSETDLDRGAERHGEASQSESAGWIRRSLRAGERLMLRSARWLLADEEFRFSSRDRKLRAPLRLDGASFDETAHQLGFDMPAVGVYSAEGWHERYGWDRERQEAALSTLRMETHQERMLGCRCLDEHRGDDSDVTSAG